MRVIHALHRRAYPSNGQTPQSGPLTKGSGPEIGKTAMPGVLLRYVKLTILGKSGLYLPVLLLYSSSSKSSRIWVQFLSVILSCWSLALGKDVPIWFNFFILCKISCLNEACIEARKDKAKKFCAVITFWKVNCNYVSFLSQAPLQPNYIL